MVYSESDLIIPTLTLLSEHEREGITTSLLIKLLQDELDVSDEDLRILKGRNDTHFSQKVRNLVSHRTLVNKGLATYSSEQKNGLHKITEAGKQYLRDNTEDYTFIIQSGFNEEQRKEVIEKDFKNLVIEEGYAIAVNQKEKRKRSRKLTELARDHFSVNGRISCRGCNFNFDDFYGKSARNYIEIHHLKPIFTYKAEDISQSLEQALQNVAPVCSNCHRMIHRNPDNILSIEDLTKLIQEHGKS